MTNTKFLTSFEKDRVITSIEHNIRKEYNREPTHGEVKKIFDRRKQTFILFMAVGSVDEECHRFWFGW